ERGLAVEFGFPGGEVQEATIVPRRSVRESLPVIGIVPASRLRLPPDGEVVRPGTAATLAVPPFEFGDEVIAMTDPQDVSRVSDLPDDPRHPGAQRDFFEFQKRSRLLAGKEMVLRMRRVSGERDIRVPPAFCRTLGLRMQMGWIARVRPGSPADKAG